VESFYTDNSLTLPYLYYCVCIYLCYLIQALARIFETIDSSTVPRRDVLELRARQRRDREAPSVRRLIHNRATRQAESEVPDFLRKKKRPQTARPSNGAEDTLALQHSVSQNSSDNHTGVPPISRFTRANSLSNILTEQQQLQSIQPVTDRTHYNRLARTGSVEDTQVKHHLAHTVSSMNKSIFLPNYRGGRGPTKSTRGSLTASEPGAGEEDINPESISPRSSLLTDSQSPHIMSGGGGGGGVNQVADPQVPPPAILEDLWAEVQHTRNSLSRVGEQFAIQLQARVKDVEDAIRAEYETDVESQHEAVVRLQAELDRIRGELAQQHALSADENRRMSYNQLPLHNSNSVGALIESVSTLSHTNTDDDRKYNMRTDDEDTDWDAELLGGSDDDDDMVDLFDPEEEPVTSRTSKMVLIRPIGGATVPNSTTDNKHGAVYLSPLDLGLVRKGKGNAWIDTDDTENATNSSSESDYYVHGNDAWDDTGRASLLDSPTIEVVGKGEGEPSGRVDAATLKNVFREVVQDMNSTAEEERSGCARACDTRSCSSGCVVM
jgi:hypothetical protein